MQVTRLVALLVSVLAIACGRANFDARPDPRSDAPDDLPRAAQVHAGTATLTGEAIEVPITAVDPTRAFLMFGASNDGAVPDGDADGFQLSGQLVEPTKLRFERAVDPGTPATIKWYVVEFQTGITVQRGRANLQNLTSIDALLAPVDPARTFPIISFRTMGGTYDAGDYLRARITSPTSLQIFRSEAEDQLSSVEWQVVQLDAGSVTSGVRDLAATELSGDVAIDAIDPARTLLLFTYSRGIGKTGLMGVRGSVVDANTLRFDRDIANGDALSIAWYAIELPPGTTVQRVATTVTAMQTSAKLDIAPVDPARALALGGGVYYRGGRSPSLVDIRGVDSFTFDLTGPTTLQLDRLVAGSQVDLEAQVIELP